MLVDKAVEACLDEEKAQIAQVQNEVSGPSSSAAVSAPQNPEKSGLMSLVEFGFLHKPDNPDPKSKWNKKDEDELKTLLTIRKPNKKQEEKLAILSAKKKQVVEANKVFQQSQRYVYEEERVVNRVTHRAENRTNSGASFRFGMNHLNAILYDEWATASDLLGLRRADPGDK